MLGDPEGYPGVGGIGSTLFYFLRKNHTILKQKDRDLKKLQKTMLDKLMKQGRIQKFFESQNWKIYTRLLEIVFSWPSFCSSKLIFPKEEVEVSTFLVKTLAK